MVGYRKLMVYEYDTEIEDQYLRFKFHTPLMMVNVADVKLVVIYIQ